MTAVVRETVATAALVTLAEMAHAQLLAHVHVCPDCIDREKSAKLDRCDSAKILAAARRQLGDLAVTAERRERDLYGDPPEPVRGGHR